MPENPRNLTNRARHRDVMRCLRRRLRNGTRQFTLELDPDLVIDALIESGLLTDKKSQTIAKSELEYMLSVLVDKKLRSP
jgi:hypothetical protein